METTTKPEGIRPVPPPPKPKRDIAAHLFRLAACLLLVGAGAIVQEGPNPGPAPRPAPETGADAGNGAVRAGGNALVVDSTALAPDVMGYGGPVPVLVRVEGGRVASVEPKLPNEESPLFFGMLGDAGLWDAWDGLPPEVAVTARVDAVASATYSSRAAIANARAAFAAAAAEGGAEVDVPAHAVGHTAVPVHGVAALAVLLAAAVVPLLTKSRRWRTVQLAIDLAVLGLWAGTFLSMARLIGWADGDLPRGAVDLASALLLLAMAFLYPLFGRPAHYCMHVCPFGAAQELASRLPVRKWRLSPALVRRLTALRRALWAALMLLLWLGLWSRWLDWELFGAFAWRVAPVPLLVAAAVFVALSAFVPRAYCRFVCPTGTLFKLAESNQPQGETK